MASHVARYEIIEKLGAGGMGVVYRARDPRLDRLVAIKVLAAHLGNDRVAKARFIQEARAASALDHLNICTIHEIDETPDGELYIVMAHYEGEPLDIKVGRGPLADDDAMNITAQIADGLAAAHARGITHRDIKPANVFVTADGVAKILDFGLAKVTDTTALTQTGQSVGSPAFMSPEQVRGDAVDERTDVWALGAVLYQLVSGMLPFRADHPQALMYQIVNEDPKPLADTAPSAPPVVADVIARCLVRDPDARTTTAADIRDLLRGVDAVATRNARKPARSSSSRPAMPIRRLATIVGATALVLPGAWYGWRALQPEPGDALRVMVLPPRVSATTGAEDAGALMSTAAYVAALKTLSDMRNIDALEVPSDQGNNPTTLSGADVFIDAEFTLQGSQWQVTLRRLAADARTVEWIDNFQCDIDELQIVDRSVPVYLQRAFPKHKMRTTPHVEVSPGDYRSFLRIAQARSNPDFNVSMATSLLDSLQAIRERNPEFVDAYVYEARFGRYLFEAQRMPEMLDRANGVAQRALSIDPTNGAILDIAFDVALSANDALAAKRIYMQAADLDPAGLSNLFRRAQLATLDGDLTGAASILEQVVRRSPTRRYLYQLAAVQYRRGHSEEALRALERVLDQVPEDTYARDMTAEIELLYGNPEHAERLYVAMAAKNPSETYFTNAGLAMSLGGKYSNAITYFIRALGEAPGSPTAMLNLADGYAMAGDTSAADSLYRAALVLTDADPNPDFWGTLVIRAQCHAHLGQTREAVQAIQKAVRDERENGEVQYAAALVYAIVGDHTSALLCVEAALTAGVEPRWFSLALFDPLGSRPEFKSLLGSPRVRS